MKPHPLLLAVAALDELSSTRSPRSTAATSGCSGPAPAGRPGNAIPDDELLHVLEGEVVITVMTDAGSVDTTVRAGSAFVVPKGLWHRHTVRECVKELYVTPDPSQHSTADDPRTEPAAP